MQSLLVLDWQNVFSRLCKFVSCTHICLMSEWKKSQINLYSMEFKWVFFCELLPKVIISLLNLNKCCCVPPEKLRSCEVKSSDPVAWASSRASIKKHLGTTLCCWMKPLFWNRKVAADFICYFSFFFLGLHLWHSSQARGWMGAADASLHHSHSNTRSELHLSSWQCHILSPLSGARDWTYILMDTMSCF